MSFARDQAQSTSLPAPVAAAKPTLAAQQNLAHPFPATAGPGLSATLTTPFNHLSVATRTGKLDSPEQYGNEKVDANTLGPTSPAKRKKRKQEKKTLQTDITEHYAPEPTRQKPSGWRETPLLVESASSPAKGPRNGSKMSRKQMQMLQFEEQNGEASDVHDLPDFDFASSNAKFDKKAAFDQIRIDDTTADEDRLVSHNRLPRPGTFGGSKLHPTEMVLERPRQDSHELIMSDSDEGIVDLAASMSSLRMRPRGQANIKRKDSSLTRESLGKVPRSSSQARLGSAYNLASPTLADPSSPSLSASKPRKPCFRYSSNGQICLAIPPTVLLAAESQAVKKATLQEQADGMDGFSLTPDILAENAGRSIAEVALAAINPGGRRATRGNFNPDPIVVILAGDCESGARAIAAGRHMAERGVRAIVTFLDIDDDVITRQPHVDRQLDRFHGKQMEWEELQTYLQGLDAPPELIIDGLFGIDTRFAALGGSNRGDALAMMAWANKSKAAVLAVDVPSGVDPDSGTVDVVLGEPAEIRAKIVVACGAPCSGLLKAMQLRHRDGYADEWKLHVCDIGITSVLRKAVKKRHRDAIAFGNAWTVPVRFESGEPAE